MSFIKPRVVSKKASISSSSTLLLLGSNILQRLFQRSVALRSLRRYWQLYLIMLPALLYFIVFKYIPMANAVIAFKDYNLVLGIWGSPWVGFKYFTMFFNNPVFSTLLQNTLSLSFYALIVGFPIPILLAVFLNEIKDGFLNEPYS